MDFTSDRVKYQPISAHGSTYSRCQEKRAWLKSSCPVRGMRRASLTLRVGVGGVGDCQYGLTCSRHGASLAHASGWCGGVGDCQCVLTCSRHGASLAHASGWCGGCLSGLTCSRQVAAPRSAFGLVWGVPVRPDLFEVWGEPRSRFGLVCGVSGIARAACPVRGMRRASLTLRVGVGGACTA